MTAVTPGREELATLILKADIEHPKGLTNDRRSLGYYASVGIDHFSHPHDTLGKLAFAAADAVLDRLAAKPADEDIQRVADAIDDARYRHPEHPRERPRPFSEADRGDREYATRLARAAVAALFTTGNPKP
jgi:hypothetical protein